MRYRILKIIAALSVAVLLAGCSLFKVSVSMGDSLSRDDVRTRVMTRGFYYDMTAEIARAADSIVEASSNVQDKIRATRWKIQATRAAVEAVMQSIPDVALSDTWILCRRMNTTFAATPDSLLFGSQSDVARDVAVDLEGRVRNLAREVLLPERYGLMERFVNDYVAANPERRDVVTTTNTTLAWIEFLKSNGIEHVHAAGSIPEVITDMSDKVGGQTRQFANTLDWSKDIFSLQMEQDSIRTQLRGQLDSLERNFTRMVTVMEHLPQISDHVIETFNKQVHSLIWAMNASVDNAFVNLDRQRGELQQFVAVEREQMMHEVSRTLDGAVRTVLDAVPSMVGKVIFWLILLLVVVLGLPFAAGFWIGVLRERVKTRKKPE